MVSERDMSHPRGEPHPLPSYPPPPASPLPSYPPGPASRPPRPPLTKRMRPAHWMAIDYAVAAVAALCALFATGLQIGPAPLALPSRLLLGGVIFFSVALRRRRPVPAFCALITAAVLGAASSPVGPPLMFMAAAYVLYTVTVTGNRQTGVAALTFAIAAILAMVILARVGQLPENRGGGVYVVVAFALIIAWMIGYSVRQRRLYAQMLQDQAASSAVAEERLRIARELHDVVAHSMSVIAVQAGYGQYVIDSSPADARDALGAIQATSRDALEEMRRMLGVLRQQDAATAHGRARSAPLAPAPGLPGLDKLIQRTRGAGVEVSVEHSGLVRALPAGIDLSAYRIIQEALTNVVKHAGGGARCTVSLGYGELALDIRVTDDGAGSLVRSGSGGYPAPRVPAAPGLPAGGAGGAGGAGHGIIGMRERANLCGGEFSAGPLPDGGFQVTVTLPLPGGAP